MCINLSHAIAMQWKFEVTGNYNINAVILVEHVTLKTLHLS